MYGYHRGRRRRSREALFVLFIALSSASAATTRFDDTAASYRDSPQADWATQDCGDCSAKPNPALTNDGTWHDDTILTGDQSASLTFTFSGMSLQSAPSNICYMYGTIIGTGVAVYGIIPPVGVAEPGNQDLTFLLDTDQTKTYINAPSGSDYQYNVQFYQILDLSNGQHTLTMTMNPNSMALVDYFVVTTPDP